MSPIRVYVGGLSSRSGERDIERLFRRFGKIREILLKNKYGFLEFEDERDAEDAVSLVRKLYYYSESRLYR